MRLKFTINKKYLLAHALRQNNITPFPSWVNLRYKLWLMNRDITCLLEGKPEWIFINENYYKSNQFNKNLNQIINFALRTKEFKKLYKETEKYLNFVKNQWQKNEKFVYNFIKKCLGLKIPPKTITTLITHPNFRNGTVYMHHEKIGWGHSEDWSNYSTVYLTHEIMHLLTKNFSGNHEILHALIELACDNELRLRLNKKGKYFNKNGFSVGHTSLRKLEKKILPYWYKYLEKKNKKNILTLSKWLNKKVEPHFNK